MGDNLISTPIPNLINGVSQQPAALRLSSQCDIQENAYATVVNGLEKRPPTKHIAKLTTANVGAAMVHTINRSTTERYSVVFKNGDLSVYTLDGVAKTVTFPDGKAYLTTATPRSSLKALSIADYTFVVNNEIPVGLASTLTADNRSSSLIFVKQGQYSTRYTIKIDDDVIAQTVTPDATIAAIQTDAIAAALQNSIGLTHRTHVTTANWTESSRTLTQVGAFTGYTWAAGDVITILGGTSVIKGDYTIASKTSNDAIVLSSSISAVSLGGGVVTKDLSHNDITSPDGPVVSDDYDISRVGSSIYIVKKDGTPITIAVEDSYGNRAMSVATNTVQKITDLPLVAPVGFTTKIIGDSGSDADDYYVKFQPQTAGQVFGNGNWVETVGPNVHTSFDTATMPFVLVRNVDGTFTFKKASWATRNVGDETSAPNPSYVGNTITDVMLFENRLGFISKDNTILSEAGQFFNFWPTTVTTLLDSDPIDVASTASPASGVATLKAAVPFQSKLILFSDHCQFVLAGADILTPKTVSCHVTTEYLSDLTEGARPIISGKNIFFPFKRGSFSGLNEYFIDTVSSNYDAAEATKHVPKYIPGSIVKLAAAPNEDFLVALTTGDTSSLYAYKYYWNNNQKLQSCWSKWSFDGATILNVDFIDTVLYITYQRDDGVYLESLSIDPGAVDTDQTFVTLLDRRITDAECPGVAYNALTDLTTWTLPYQTAGTMQIITRPTGALLTVVTQGPTTLTAHGDHTTTPVFIGVQYSQLYRFSKPQLHEQQPGGVSGVVSTGRIQIRNWTLVYDQTGYIRAAVTPEGRDTYSYLFTGRLIGEAATPLGSAALRSGRFVFPVYSQYDRVTIDIINDSPLPSRILCAEWEALFVIRNSRF